MPCRSAESFLNLLERERIRRGTYRTRDEARQDVFDDIEMFYNPKRKHARNTMLSPAEFERQQMLRRQRFASTILSSGKTRSIRGIRILAAIASAANLAARAKTSGLPVTSE